MASRPDKDLDVSSDLKATRNRFRASEKKLSDHRGDPSPRDDKAPRGPMVDKSAKSLGGGAKDFKEIEGKSIKLTGPKVREVRQKHVPDAKKARSDVRPSNYKLPVTRAKRLSTDDGRTSFHFSHDSVSKTNRESTTSTGLANRPGAAREHTRYIERDSAVAQIDASDLDKDLENGPQAVQQRAAADLTASAAGGVYIERQEALATREDGTRVLFTNIDDDPNERLKFWSLVDKHERDAEPDQMTIHTGTHADFWNAVRRDPACPKELADAIDIADPAKPYRFKTNDNVLLREFLTARDEWPKNEDGAIVRGKGSPAIFTDGRGGRTQYRIIGELPHEISEQERSSILKEFSKEFEERKLPYVAVMHAPDHTNNDKNWHFHLVYYDRPCDRITEEQVIANAKRRNDAGEVKAVKPNMDHVGQWDFSISEVYLRPGRYEKRQNYPYAQEKLKEAAQDRNWIPKLRTRLAEITNDHLERAGINRRLDARTYEEMGIHVDPQEHLGTKMANLEAMGIATATGTRNEDRQWNATMEKIDRGFAMQRKMVDQEAERLRNKLARSKLPDADRVGVERNIVRWHQHRNEAEEFSVISEKVGEHLERTKSRAEKVLHATKKHLDAIKAGKATKFQSSREGAHRRKYDEASAELGTLVEFLKDEAKLFEDSKASAKEERAKAEKLLVSINNAMTFDIAIADAGREKIREKAEDRKTDQPQTEKDDQRRALNKAAMDAWINGIMKDRRRLVFRERKIVPMDVRPGDDAVISAINYGQMAARLTKVKETQDRLINEMISHIQKFPYMVKETVVDGKTVLELDSPNRKYKTAFADYREDPVLGEVGRSAVVQNEAASRATTRRPDITTPATPERKAPEPARAPVEAKRPVERPDPAKTPERAPEPIREPAASEPAKPVRVTVHQVMARLQNTPRRLVVENGIVLPDPEQMREMGISAATLRTPDAQKRLARLNETHEREQRRVIGYAEKNPKNIVEVNGRLILSPNANQELFQIATKWIDDEAMQRRLAEARDRKPEIRPAAPAAPEKVVDTQVPVDRPEEKKKTPVVEPEKIQPRRPRVVTISDDADMEREASRLAALEQARKEAAARTGPRTVEVNAVPSGMTPEEFSRIQNAARAPTNALRGVHPKIDRWVDAVTTQLPAEERQRIAEEIMADVEAKRRLEDIDRQIARRIRDDDQKGRDGRQLGLGLDLDRDGPKR